ncbi:MAG: RIP metalloprotease RseP [Pseudomonadota bacterium]
MFEAVSAILNQGLSYIIPFIILIGLLIFVHELGHFLAAKFFNVKVETFSLGFGPKILKFIYGETTYCVSALPFGGYVKMYGDEPGKDVPAELKERSYLHKPVGQRIIVALAGPLMNLFFAGLLFIFVAQIGDKALAPQIGEIARNSEAFQNGFRPYDEIKKINGREVKTWDQVKEIIESSGNKKLNFEIARLGDTKNLEVTPPSRANDNLFSTADRIGKVKGLHSRLHLPIVGVSYQSALYEMGLRSGDQIMEIDGESVKWFKDIEPSIFESLNAGGGTAKIKVKRFKNFRNKDSGEELNFTLHAMNFKSQSLDLFFPEAVIAEVQEDSPAAAAGLLKGDRILSINDNPIVSFDDIITNVSSFKVDGPPLKIEIQRESQNQIFEIVPNMNSLEGQYGEKENRFTIGVFPTLFSVPKTFLWKSPSMKEAVSRSFQQTKHWTNVTLLSFVRIFQNRVSSKNISGIISIGQIAQQSWELGLNAFLKIMAIISINLFILNLLPIPILDGGHLMLFTLEAIKGAPISLKKVEMAQQVGFLIILFLMAFALFNDFSRIFGS